MKKGLWVGTGLVLVVILALPLLLGERSERTPGESFMTPDYAQRLGLQEVSWEMLRSCTIATTYEDVVRRLGVPGVLLHDRDDLPPIPFETMRDTWRGAIDHPEKEVYAWVTADGEVMTITFLNGKSVHVYYGQHQ
jgi:hypothetical protein